MSAGEPYFAEIAAAYVRGLRPECATLADDDAQLAWAVRQGIELDRYKRKQMLPRVQAAIGVLMGLYPASVLDVGSQRGTFLWPAWEALSAVTSFTALEHDSERFAQLKAVEMGGLPNYHAVQGDGCRLPFADGSFDAVTILEVFEHLPKAEEAAREVMRVTRRMVIASVPSRPDNNPDHLRLYTADTLRAMLYEAGAVKVSISQVPGHYIAVASK
jgi:ubiquinone/menaquinone biosynthesis C-methylase UbiE